MLRKLLVVLTVVGLFGFGFADSDDKGNSIPIVELAAIAERSR